MSKLEQAQEWLRACGRAALNGAPTPPAPAEALLEHVDAIAQVECFKSALHAMGLGHMAVVLRQLVAVEAERDRLQGDLDDVGNALNEWEGTLADGVADTVADLNKVQGALQELLAKRAATSGAIATLSSTMRTARAAGQRAAQALTESLGLRGGDGAVAEVMAKLVERRDKLVETLNTLDESWDRVETAMDKLRQNL